MKKIKVNRIDELNKKYVVTLGNGSQHHFNSIRKAEAFQNKTNKFLTELLYQVNQLYSDLFQVYRQCWGYFTPTESTHNFKYFSSGDKIKKDFENIDSLLTALTENQHRKTSYYRVYADFRIIHESIINICTSLNNVIQSKSITFLNIRINQFITNANHLNNSIQNYATTTTNHPITYDRNATALIHSLIISQSA
jgi:hypothetical protein